MAEQLTLNQLVGSSSLPRLTTPARTNEPVRTARTGSRDWRISTVQRVTVAPSSDDAAPCSPPAPRSRRGGGGRDRGRARGAAERCGQIQARPANADDPAVCHTAGGTVHRMAGSSASNGEPALRRCNAVRDAPLVPNATSPPLGEGAGDSAQRWRARESDCSEQFTQRGLAPLRMQHGN